MDTDTRATNTVEPLGKNLVEHARHAAYRARQKLGGVLDEVNLHLFLTDPQCLRYSTSLVFDRKGLEPHQFAQPELVQNAEGCWCTLHIDSRLRNQPDKVCLVVAYMAAAINYGDAATAEVAELLGSILTGMPRDAFYKELCTVAECLDLPQR